MRVLELSEVLEVSGGDDIVCGYPMPEYFRDDFLINELLAYQTGLSSVFGVNPDLQGDVPPPPA